MNDFQENIVPAINQNDENVFLYNNENSKIKILFVGNSIAKHAPKPSIGWTNDCGMAASSIEKDFVHLIVKKIIEKYDPNVSFGIAQVAQYARTFFDKTPDAEYSLARDFDADLIIMFYGANVSKDYDTMENPPKTFETAYEDMRNYLKVREDTIVYHSEGFYVRPRLEAEKRAVAEKYNETYMDISAIKALPESRGKFNHPSDLGMAMIADTFWKYVEADVARICNSK